MIALLARSVAASLLLLGLAPAAPSRPALPYTDVQVVALSLADRRAVIQFPEGDPRTVAVGDEIPEVGARVVQVLRDRLVLQELSGKAGRQVWIYRATGAGKSRVQVLDRRLPPPAGGQAPEKATPGRRATPRTAPRPQGR